MTAISADGHMPAPVRRWSRYKHPRSTIRFAVLIAVLAFLSWSIAFLNIDLYRIIGAFPRLWEILATATSAGHHYVLDDNFCIRCCARSRCRCWAASSTWSSDPLAWMAARSITISRRIAIRSVASPS